MSELRDNITQLQQIVAEKEAAVEERKTSIRNTKGLTVMLQKCYDKMVEDTNIDTAIKETTLNILRDLNSNVDAWSLQMDADADSAKKAKRALAILEAI